MNASHFPRCPSIAWFRRFALGISIFAALLSGMPAAARTFFVSMTDDTTTVSSLRGAIVAANRLGGHNVIVLTSTTYKLTIPGIDEDAGLTGDLDVTRGVLMIISPGANAVIDAGDLGDRIFQVMGRANLTLRGVTLRGGHAFGGDYGSFVHFEGEAGGAIYNAGKVTLRNCALIGNTSGTGGTMQGNGPGGPGGTGGAIYNTGKLTMQNCVIEGNSSGPATVSGFGGDGGGVYNSGECVLSACTIVGNSSGSGGHADSGIGMGGSGGNGAGICNAGTMLLKKCTISGNLTGSGTDGTMPGWSDVGSSGSPGGHGGHGAGIFNSGALQLNLCTVSGNTNGSGGHGGAGGEGGNGGAGGSGGGIFDIGSLTIESCTISANFTGQGGDGGNARFGPGGNGGAGGDGGGIFCGGADPARSRNSIVALNSTGEGGVGGSASGTIPVFTNPTPVLPLIGAGPKGSGDDVSGPFSSSGFNLIGDASGSSGITNGLNADLAGDFAEPIDPLLGPLQDNGGPTFTHALLHGSPAIDQGKSSGFRSSTDQRGRRRPVSQFSVPAAPTGDGSDIGAFELQNASLRRGGNAGR